MKRVLAFILTTLMLFSLCACGPSAPVDVPEGEGTDNVEGPTSRDAIDGYYESLVDADGEAMFRFTVHPFVFEQAVAEGMFGSEEEAIAILNGDAEKAKAELEQSFGPNLGIDVVYNATTEYSGEDVDKINKYLSDNAKYPENYVSELHVLEVEVTVKGDNDSASQGGEIVVAKIEGNWYMVSFPGIQGNESIKAVLGEN